MWASLGTPRLSFFLPNALHSREAGGVPGGGDYMGEGGRRGAGGEGALGRQEEVMEEAGLTYAVRKRKKKNTHNKHTKKNHNCSMFGSKGLTNL